MTYERLRQLARVYSPIPSEGYEALRALAPLLADYDRVVREKSELESELGMLRERALNGPTEPGDLAERIRLNLRTELDKLRCAAPVMLTAMAIIADEASVKDLRDIVLWYEKHEPEHLNTWLAAELARVVREQAKESA